MMHRLAGAASLALLSALTGCGALVSRAADSFAHNLTTAILDQNDPETVRDGAPAYLLLIDSLLEGNPDNPQLLDASALLYSAYASLFAGDPERAQRLSARGRDQAEHALCLVQRRACGMGAQTFEQQANVLAQLDRHDVPALYGYCVASLAYIRAHRDDWAALAALPNIEATLARVQDLDPEYQAGSVQLYLGILDTLRPEALGGRPEEGRAHFERAIALSEGRDLAAKVELARSYARLVYDRELHDRVLNEVVQADPQEPGLTLLNVIAQREARALLASADDYF
jgi:TRAP transporter T-component